LHEPANVSVLPEHEVAPHDVPEPGRTHAPVVSHAVAVLQTSVPAAQGAEQQLPTPPTSHAPLVHSWFAVQGSPAGSFGVHVVEAQ
jgi:hypothetical protein